MALDAENVIRTQVPPKKSSAFRLRAIRYAQISAPTDSDYIVKGLLDRGTLAEVYGEPNCGKTFLVTDMALHVAANLPWMGRRVRGGLAVYIATEGRASAMKRITAWRSEHPELGEDLPFVLVPETIALNAKKDIDELLRIIRELEKEYGPARLIALDTLSRSMPGLNENSPEAMTAAIAVLARLRDETGAAVLVVHHSGKDKGRGSRGHSSLLGAVDTEIEIIEHEGLRTMQPNKQRDYEKGEGSCFRLAVVELGLDGDHDPITTCVVRPTDERPAPKPDGAESLKSDDLKAYAVLLNHANGAGNSYMRMAEWVDKCLATGLLDNEASEPARKKAMQRIVGRLERTGMVVRGEGLRGFYRAVRAGNGEP